MNIQNIWAPWRMAYLHELKRQAGELGRIDSPAGSFLARYWQSPQDDEKNHVVYRDSHGMILLNRYPYANGHLLIALGDARPTLGDYDSDQRATFWQLVDRAVDLAQRTLNPQGVNIGVNQGDAAGAGVPDHLHAHVVPRWAGDTNFMTVVSKVRVIPEALDVMAKRYRQTLANDQRQRH